MITLGELAGVRRPRRGHDGKVVFASAGLAEAAIRALVRRGERERGQALIEGETLHAYRCDEDRRSCGVHWHIGHEPKRKGEQDGPARHDVSV